MGDDPIIRPLAQPGPAEPAPTGLRTYLATLFEHSLSGEDLDDDVEIEVRPIKGAKPLHSYRGAKSIPAAIKLVRGASDAGADVYNGVHLRRRGTERGGDHAITVLTAIICDVDCDKTGITRSAAVAAVDASPFGPPTMSVWSGGGVHGYWIYNERVEATPDAIKAHRMGCAYLRAWLQTELGRGLTAESAAKIADDMSTPDRILRSPGTRNMKPARAAKNGGVAPPVEIIALRESKWIDIADVPDLVPPGFNPDAFAGRISRARTPGDVADLPTELPERLRRVLTHARIPFRLAKSGEHVTAVKLLPCPACGQADGGCFLTPKSGSLRTYHASSCPASTYPAGIPLDEWVYRFARAAQPMLDAPAPVPVSQTDRATRLAHAISGFYAAPTPESTAGLCDHALAGLALADVAFVSASEAEDAPSRGPGALPRELAKLAGDAGALLAPLRDVSGAVVQAIWVSTGQTLPPRVALSKGDDAVAGGVLVLGHLPAAARRAGDGASLLLAHGTADYLAALGIVAELGEDAAVLGITSDAGRVVDHLASHWTLAGVRPRRVVAIVGPGYSDDAIKRLDGVAGVVVVEATPAGLNAALLSGMSPEGVKRRIRSEPARFRAPVHILDAGRHIEADIRAAATYAANTSTAERRTLVVYAIPPGGGKTTAGQMIASEIATGALVVPVVGKRPRDVPESMWPPTGRAVGFALPNHNLADEKHRDHIDRGIAATPDRFQSALRDCHFAERVRPAYRFVGRRGICGDKGKPNRCEHAEQGCPGAITPAAQRGAVAYVAHAMVRFLKLDFAFIDEDVGVIDQATVTEAEISTLHLGYPIPRVKRWRTTDNPEAVAAAEMLRDLFGPLARKHGDDVAHGRVQPFARRIGGEELCRLLETGKNLVPLLGVAFSKDSVKPPQPWPNELRAGPDIHRHMPHGGAWLALVELLAMYRRLRPEKAEPNALPMFEAKKSPPPMVDLVLNSDGTWSLATRTIKPLPDCPVVILDATGELTLAEYQAAYPHFHVTMRGVQLWGAVPKPAIHIRTKGASKAALFTPTGHLRPPAPTVVRNIVRRLATEVRARRPNVRERRLSLGLLTYKDIHDCITGATSGGGVLATLRAEMLADGFDLRVGYHGRDDRGTNAFERVDGLAVIGDARQNMGEVEADCVLLGLDYTEVFHARAEAVLVQALFRARHTRRTLGDEAVVLLASADRPHVPGVAWIEEAIPRATAAAEALDVAAFVAGELGVIGEQPIITFPWIAYDQPAPKISNRGRQEAIQRVLQGRPDWRPYAVTLAAHGGAPCQVWAASIEAVEAWAFDVAGTRKVSPGLITAAS